MRKQKIKSLNNNEKNSEVYKKGQNKLILKFMCNLKGLKIILRGKKLKNSHAQFQNLIQSHNINTV